MEFEWDGRKARANISKHRVGFEEASTIFGDPHARTIHDPDHSEHEDRYITVGMSAKGRLIVVSHTDREERLRLISARRATSRETHQYEQEAR